MLLRNLIIIMILWGVAPHTGWSADAAGEKADLQRCYDGFRRAIETRNGEEALTLISKESMAYYGDMLEKALHADTAALAPLSLADKYLVLSIRHRTPSEKIPALNAESVYAFSVERMWLGTAVIQARTLDKVASSSPDKAQAALVKDGVDTGNTIFFTREENHWKVDLKYQTAIIDGMLTKALKESGLSEQRFFEQILEVATHTAPEASLWEPLAPAGNTP